MGRQSRGHHAFVHSHHGQFRDASSPTGMFLCGNQITLWKPIQAWGEYLKLRTNTNPSLGYNWKPRSCEAVALLVPQKRACIVVDAASCLLFLFSDDAVRLILHWPPKGWTEPAWRTVVDSDREVAQSSFTLLCSPTGVSWQAQEQDNEIWQRAILLILDSLWDGRVLASGIAGPFGSPSFQPEFTMVRPLLSVSWREGGAYVLRTLSLPWGIVDSHCFSHHYFPDLLPPLQSNALCSYKLLLKEKWWCCKAVSLRCELCFSQNDFNNTVARWCSG